MAQTDVRTVYKLKAFDSAAAMAGALCVMYKKEPETAVQEDTEISNIKVDGEGIGSPNEDFMGAGVCTFKEPNKFLFLLDSKYYAFNEKGYGANGDSLDYKLWLAELSGVSKAEVQTVGRWIKTGVKVVNKITLDEPVANAGQTPTFDDGDETLIDVGSGGTGSGTGGSSSGTGGSSAHSSHTDEPVKKIVDNTSIQYTQDADEMDTMIQIASLNARDEFATQVLNGMLSKLPSPAGLSDNEMNYYCNAAYQWAANMMAASARSRSTDDDQTSSSANMEQTTALESNTEKLLHNLVVATGEIKSSLQRTDEATTTGSGDNQTTSYAERVTLKGVTMSSIQALIDQQRGMYIDGNDEVQYRGKSAHEQAVEGKMDTYMAKVPTGTTRSVLGLQDLINAIGNISVSATGGSTTVDTSGIVAAIQNLASSGGNRNVSFNSDSPLYLSRGTQANPIYISGGAFPARQALATNILAENIHDVVAFVEGGGVGYATIVNLASAVLTNMTAADIMAKISSEVNNSIKSWLSTNTVSVNVNGTPYRLIRDGAF